MARFRKQTALGPVVLVLLGVGLGVILTWWQPQASLQANTLSRSEAGRLASDLRRPDWPLLHGNQELAKLARLLRPSVVHIQSRHAVRGGVVEETGSGAIVELAVAGGPYVVTNRHVVHDAAELSDILVLMANGRFLSPARMWQDKASDIAVLELPEVPVVPAHWGDSDQLKIGNFVLALGSPFGLSQSVTMGIVSAKGRRSLELGPTGQMLNQNFIQTDAAINPGNSGGPLVNLHGQIVGINTAIASSSGGNEGIAFSIPSNLARRIAESLVRNGHVRRAYIGVQLDDEFSAHTARTYHLKRVRGARVVTVYRGTPAADAGLQANDLILEFNGIEVQGYNHLINLVSLTPTGKAVRLTILRDGRTIRRDLVLADRSELSARQDRSQQGTLPVRRRRNF